MSDLAEVKTFVGAKKVGCNKCIFCLQCLVEKEILYTVESQITAAIARKDNLRCSSCNCILAHPEGFEHRKHAEKLEN